MSWAWWDWPLTWLTNHCPSVLWHCWLGHLTSKIISEMTYDVSSGTLNTTILYAILEHFPIICLPCHIRTYNHRNWLTSVSGPCSKSLLRLLKKFLIDWLIDLLTDWFIDSLTDWLIDWLTDWLIDWLIDWCCCITVIIRSWAWRHTG